MAYEWREGTDVLALEASPSIFLTVGVHTLDTQVTDDRGATGTDTVVISVRGNTPPTANAGADQTVTDGDGNGVETVTLDGSASSDADGSILSYEWSEGATVFTTGASPSVSFAVGYSHADIACHRRPGSDGYGYRRRDRQCQTEYAANRKRRSRSDCDRRRRERRGDGNAQWRRVV